MLFEQLADLSSVCGRRGMELFPAGVRELRVRDAEIRHAGCALDEPCILEAAEQAGDARWRQQQVPRELHSLQAPPLGLREHEQRLEVVDRQSVGFLQLAAQRPRCQGVGAHESRPGANGRVNRLLGQNLRHQGIMVELFAYSIVHHATKGAVNAMNSAILTIAPAGTWNLDPVHSRVDFEVSYLAGTFKGHFNEIGAELTVDGERATLEGTTKVASIDVNEENLSAHLQSPDFFDAERYPELRFTAEDIRLDGDGQVSVGGELTIKGVTKPVTVTGTVTSPMSDPYGSERIGLNLTTTIDRTDFGINWNNPLPSGEPSLANDVTVLAELQFVKQAEES